MTALLMEFCLFSQLFFFLSQNVNLIIITLLVRPSSSGKFIMTIEASVVIPFLSNGGARTNQNLPFPPSHYGCQVVTVICAYFISQLQEPYQMVTAKLNEDKRTSAKRKPRRQIYHPTRLRKVSCMSNALLV